MAYLHVVTPSVYTFARVYTVASLALDAPQQNWSGQLWPRSVPLGA